MENAPACRDVLAADAAVVTQHRFEGSMEHPLERKAYESWVSARIRSGAYIGRVAEIEGRVVAGAGLVLLDWGPTRGNVGGVCGRVVAVFTEPAWRRRGLAGGLVEQVMDRAAEQGVRDFRLAASANGAMLYRGLGFRPYGAEMVFKA
jgi:GNAT superfamily N-acetyltransferase